jgi:5-formyltetrahydrofolate cyclo-ligase
MSSSEKQRLRRQMRADCDALNTVHRAAASARIAQHFLALPVVERASTLFVYVSYRAEVQTHRLIQRLLAQERSVVVPKMVSDGDGFHLRMIAVPLRRFDDLQPGRFGILEPSDEKPFGAPIEVCIAPGLAFTERGDRVGSGVGHYDRFLAEHSIGITIGLAFECQIVPHIASEPHDQRMDILVTEDRVIRCNR